VLWATEVGSAPVASYVCEVCWARRQTVLPTYSPARSRTGSRPGEWSPAGVRKHRPRVEPRRPASACTSGREGVRCQLALVVGSCGFYFGLTHFVVVQTKHNDVHMGLNNTEMLLEQGYYTGSLIG